MSALHDANSLDRSENAPLWYALAGLLLTVVLALIWSHWKLLWVDELLVLETDSAPTAAAVLHIQRNTPIALDPAAYHLVVHSFLRTLGENKFALRLPSLIGFTTMQLCLFALVRRMAGARSAVLALMLPAISGTFYYATETRPYGMLLGCFGLALLSYCRAAVTEADGQRRSRLPWLLLLAFSVGLSLNTHYFGLLLLGPLAVAELTRIVMRRRFDPVMAAALCVGAGSYLFTKPFQAGALLYRQHYYNAGGVNVHAVISSFHLILLNLQFRPSLQRLTSVLIALFCLTCLFVPLARVLRGTGRLRPHELALLITLALLPFAGVAIGIFITHSFEVRYVLGAVLAYAALFGVVMEPALRRAAVFHATVGTLLVVMVALNAFRIRVVRAERDAVLAAMRLTPEQRGILIGAPERAVYVQNGGWFQQLAYYMPDEEARARLTMLYGFAQEMRYGGRDTNSLTASNMRAFTGFRIMPWQQLQRTPGEHVLLVYSTGWDWVRAAMFDPAEHATVRDLGPALGGELYGVSFPLARAGDVAR